MPGKTCVKLMREFQFSFFSDNIIRFPFRGLLIATVPKTNIYISDTNVNEAAKRQVDKPADEKRQSSTLRLSLPYRNL